MQKGANESDDTGRYLIRRDKTCALVEMLASSIDASSHVIAARISLSIRQSLSTILRPARIFCLFLRDDTLRDGNLPRRSFITV